MKTFIQTITVFVALNLATASSTPAQITTVDTAPPTRTEWPTAESFETTDSFFAVEPTEPSVNLYGKSLIRQQYATTLLYSAPVLVIPAAEMKAEDLVTIMEDMNVMSRIFDKQLAKANLIKSPDYSWIYSRRSTSSTGQWLPLLGRQPGRPPQQKNMMSKRLKSSKER